MPEPILPLFFVEPFVTGLVFAGLLPLLGAYLRLRDEWLAALAFAQTAAAGTLLAMLAGAPLLVGGVAAAAAAAVAKSLLDDSGRGGRATYALLLVGAWAVSVLLVSNLPLAERLGQSLFDGQLYLTDRDHLLAALLSLPLVGAVLLRSSRALLQSHFFPDFFRARGRSARRVHFVFDLLVAVTLALATASIGVMAAFALIFLPPLMAWRWATGWRASLLLAVAIGVSAHGLAFTLALRLDQPFGPVLALLLVGLALLSAAAGHWPGARKGSR